MNTVEMLRLASRVLGISPKDAMRAAEHLYLDGLISYPRTESSGYPSELAKQLPGVVLLHVEHDEWGAIAATIVDPETGAKTGRWTAPPRERFRTKRLIFSRLYGGCMAVLKTWTAPPRDSVVQVARIE